MPRITLTRDDGGFVITDEQTGVTTHGGSKLEALLQLVDALAEQEADAVDPLGLAIDAFVSDSGEADREPVGGPGAVGPDASIEIDASIADRFREVATEVIDDEEGGSAVEELGQRLLEHADAGRPWLTAPLTPEEINEIDDDRLRALAWDLDATASAYNYASDPLLPDLAREDPAPWVGPEAQRRLELASKLLFDVHARLLERIGDELRFVREST